MKKRLIAGMMISAAMLPVFASAQTTNVQAQIQALLSQIQALQLQLRTLIASSTANIGVPNMEGNLPPGQLGKALCIRLGRDLRVGSQGEDVRTLQEMLREDRESGFSGNPTGFFGPLTAKAMMKFQTRMGIASSTTGTVGSLTRGFFERRCGEGLRDKEDNDEKRRAVAGEITAVATSSITVKAGDNASRVVNITASTTIKVISAATSTPTTGSMTDLTVGKRVSAVGTPNSDGSLTATEIKVGTIPSLQKPMKGPRFDNRGKRMMEDDDGDDD